jgi:hypothetical protein
VAGNTHEAEPLEWRERAYCALDPGTELFRNPINTVTRSFSREVTDGPHMGKGDTPAPKDETFNTGRFRTFGRRGRNSG